ncbi:YoaK family protein [Methylocystis echinoides]|uniref:YoaK family protein n=1 Tax=Methylocystis echinoides TaxID=29468 RepID=UPI0034431C74
MLLSVIAGATDTICFLGLNGLFTAHITGNVVVLAANLVTGKPAVASYLLSVPVFMFVLYMTRMLAIRFERIGLPPLRPLLFIQLLFLVACLEISVFDGSRLHPQSVAMLLAGMSAVCAMAVQNALAQIAFKKVPSTAVMTTNVTHFVLDLTELVHARDYAAARDRALRTLPVIAGFVLGCALGAIYQAAAGLWSLSLPTSLALVALLIAEM